MRQHTVEDVACTVCGCVCDDLRVRLEGDRIAGIEPPCPLAEAWFARQNAAAPAEAEIEGRAVTVTAAIERATQLLQASKSPLVYGLSRSSTPGQRAAVALADQLGANIDTTASSCHAPSILALQAVGESTCSLGEVRNRCDLVLYWGSNPAESHPRHLERYAGIPCGPRVPHGRADRTLMVVDIRETETTALADDILILPPGTDFDLLWALRAKVRKLPLDAPAVAGVPRDRMQVWAQRLQSCRSGVVFFGRGLARGPTGHANVEALLRLVTDLNACTRFYARRMRIHGDVAGADSVLCWQTGFPFSVNLARGYPRYSYGEYSANELLARREVDCCLLVGSEGVESLSAPARVYLQSIPTIALDYPAAACSFTPTVVLRTAIYGIHRAGTAYRMDETPIPLRPFLDSNLPSDHEVLDAIRTRLR